MMPEEPTQTEQNQAEQFQRQADSPSPGLVAEFAGFLSHNKKWWLTPIIVVLLSVAVLIWLGGSAAPFIYALF